ncbi:MAG: sporulation protein YjcZ [Candidatus Micrarchaeota archaeon]|nr:sporulation protein YjcZ [Candidatus Micrarchaeota archaeon]
MAALFGYGGYGMMGYGSGYGMGMMYGAYPAYGLLVVVFGVVLGAFVGAVIGVSYNWALKLK